MKPLKVTDETHKKVRVAAATQGVGISVLAESLVLGGLDLLSKGKIDPSPSVVGVANQGGAR